MPSSGSPGITRREALELGVDRVTRADVDVAVVLERVEAVERAHRRTAGDLAAEVVDAAVARADETLGGLDVADRAPEVHAARGERDVVVVLVVRLGVDRGVALAHVGDRLARLADPGDDHQHLGDVGELVEIGRRADDLPVERVALEHRAEREPERRQPERRRGDAAGAVRDAGHEPPAGDRLALERPRHLAVGGVLRGLLVSVCWHLIWRSAGAEPGLRVVSLPSIPETALLLRRRPMPALAGRARSALGGPGGPAASGRLAAVRASLAPQPTATAPASQTASASSASPPRAPGRRAR